MKRPKSSGRIGCHSWRRDIDSERIRYYYVNRGETLQQISDRFNMTKQAIHSRLKKLGVTRNEGGFHNRAVQKELKRQLAIRLKASARARKRGMSKDEYDNLPRAFYKAYRHFRRSRLNPDYRHLPFRLTLAQFVAIWSDSGKWSKHGRTGYVLARKSRKRGFYPSNLEVIHRSGRR